MKRSSSFFAELQRRHVYKVGAMYCVAGWLLVQIVTQVFPIFDVSALVQRIIVLLIIAGFPVALVLAWLFDLTPQGIVRTADLPANGEAPSVIEQRRTTDRKLNYVLGALLLIGAAYILADHSGYLDRADTHAGDQKTSTPTDKSVAVLPFENLSDDKANAYFAEGMQDEILTRLSKVHALKVISRASTQHYSSKPDNLPEIARQLGVANVLEGRVQKSGNAVHINVQLIRAATEDPLWAESYDRKLDNMFSVEGEVAGAVAEALNATLSGTEQQALDAKTTSNADAWDAYLRGLALFNRGEVRPDLLESERALKMAVQLDPGFAQAWALLVRVHGSFVVEEWDTSAARRDAARDALAHVVSLQPDAIETRIARAYCEYWVERDYAAARTLFEDVRRQEPNNADAALALAFVTRRQGRWDETLPLFEQAIALDPRNLEALEQAAVTAQAVGQVPLAEHYLDQARQVAPADPGVTTTRATLLQLEGRLDEAQRVLMLTQPSADDPFQVKVAADQAWLQRRFADGSVLMQDMLGRVSASQHVERATYSFYLSEFQRFAGDTGKVAGSQDEATSQAMEALREQPDNADVLDLMALIAARRGREPEARRCLQQAVQTMPRGGDVLLASKHQSTLARIETYLGHDDAAITALQGVLTVPGVYEVGRPWITRATLALDPDFDSLRGQPGFQRLLAEDPAGRNP